MLQKKQTQKVDIPNLTLYYQLQELFPTLKEAFINKVQELENNWLKLKLRTRQGGKNLIITQNAIFLSQYKLEAKKQTSGYGAFLRKRIEGKKILDIEQHELERLLEITFEGFYLIVELFAKGNIILLDSKRNILMPFHKEEWATRKIKKGEKYSYPPALGKNPLKLKLEELQSLLSESEEDLIHALIKNIAIAPLFLEEVCFNSEIEKSMQANAVSKQQIKTIFKEIKNLFSKKPSPVLIQMKNKITLSPFPLNFCKESILKEFPSIDLALDELFAGKLLKQESFKQSTKIKELEISLQRQKQALEDSLQAILDQKKKAEAIYTNYNEIKKIILALEAYKKEKITEKEIMYKLKYSFPLIKNLDIRKGILTIESK